MHGNSADMRTRCAEATWAFIQLHFLFFFQAEDGIRDYKVTGVQTCALPIFTYRRMAPQTGGKGSYGHRHRTQEEIYFVVSGQLEFKLDDEVLELGPLTAIRVAQIGRASCRERV